MELSLDPGNATYRISAYQEEAGQVTLLINSEKITYDLPILIMPERLVTTFHPKIFNDLKAEDLQQLLEYNPQVVLLGTGEKNHFLKPELQASLAKENIGIEVMSTAAACRTYTILMAEGRNVAALLFP